MRYGNAGPVTVLVDNDSWILCYANILVGKLKQLGFDAELVRTASEIREGWICFFLGCVHIVNTQYLARNVHNLVVHESDLPKGRGFAPMAWQILQGSSSIPVCLIEASEDEPDAGNIWLKDTIELEGNELLPKWRQLQGEKSVELCLKFVTDYESLISVEQVGEPTWFKRRSPSDSELDPAKSLGEQYNLLRIVDNERYPAFVRLAGKKIILQVDYEN